MNYQIRPKSQLGCLALLAVVTLLISFPVTGSLNPLAVYSSNSLWAKIAVSFIAVWLAISLLQVLYFYLVVKSLARGGVKGEDTICPGCGLPLLQYIGSHGIPIVCPKCEKPWHNGPACYNKGMPRPTITFPTYLCPHCLTAAAHDRDLFDDQGSASY